MKKGERITVKTLNKAMTRSSRRAIRTNKALGLDTVLVKNNKIIRMDPSGNEFVVKKLDQKRTLEPAKPISFR
ncbi:MAG: hypothetical protein WD038_04140 [Balneolales bacterium]